MLHYRNSKHQSLSWLVLFSWKEGGFLYPVSEAFLQEVQENARRYYWTGMVITITTESGQEYDGKKYIREGSDLKEICL